MSTSSYTVLASKRLPSLRNKQLQTMLYQDVNAILARQNAKKQSHQTCQTIQLGRVQVMSQNDTAKYQYKDGV